MEPEMLEIEPVSSDFVKGWLHGRLRMKKSWWRRLTSSQYRQGLRHGRK